jgi:hypothetical protein
MSSLNILFKTQYTPNSSMNQCRCNPPALPLSKINKINTSTNDSSLSCRMRYSQVARSNGTTMASTSSNKKTCSLGGPTFSY